MKDIIALRHYLHQHPELSNHEVETATTLSAFIQALHPAATFDVGSTGKIALFKGAAAGPTVLFRAELDALPIGEISTLPYRSQNGGVAHLCGHDGHMSILAGLAQYIARNKPTKGTVGLLFQPAEEVEQGARDVLHSKVFQQLKPDYMFALHNIPGYPLHQVILKEGSFSAASQGMTVTLSGKTAHAAEPENGLNPATAIARIIDAMHRLRTEDELFEQRILITIIHIQLGEIAFGTSPGHAIIRMTLRAFENRDMEQLTKIATSRIRQIAQKERLGCSIEFSEVFPATMNDAECVSIVEDVAKHCDLSVVQRQQPFSWSEDFGYYTSTIKGGFFGIGAGTEQAALHNPDYDFPDALLKTGIDLFSNIYRKLLCE
ncbi:MULTISPECIES: amidohydrolase [unclassified Carboxylicivirga]|uniref:amidohydrolase n=1 Tax=Carboxylicivirga TaxID=1628153 RepID=UPI003D335498